ncbi:CcdB protein (plasmid) [Hoeflea sp. IMCC20628]|uniref:CcdB family protein n=1 Tax=Hoeflea sp. IMCC20628 TaxID=1620421 RepID=UPI00063BEF64|nr:CcdB protein [Hoeflea sp. IMCC20628]
MLDAGYDLSLVSAIRSHFVGDHHTGCLPLPTQFLAAVPRSLLRSPVTSLVGQDNEIMAALDMLLVGF